MTDQSGPRGDEGPDRPDPDTAPGSSPPPDLTEAGGDGAEGGPSAVGSATPNPRRGGPHRPASPGGLNSVGMNTGGGHAGSNPRGKRARTTGDAGGVFCDLAPCDASICDCGGTLLTVSLLLRVSAALVPATGSGRGVQAVLRFYRRHLTRFTPTCPATPSCSAFAQEAVAVLGPRRGLAAAAGRVRACGRPERLTDR
jgi:hypothetical protein